MKKWARAEAMLVRGCLYIADKWQTDAEWRAVALSLRTMQTALRELRLARA